ncbi:MAG: hypothetical protein IT303_19735 [Dehalococcoidia bacterium]|nr:hypothetical protein [Dehalococcoidia bacterium]
MGWFVRYAAWFSTPGRQAGAWSALGIAGFALGTAGVMLLLDGGGSGGGPARVDGTPTAGAIAATTPSPSRTASSTATAPSATPSSSPTPSETPSPSPTAPPPTPAERTATPAPEPTEAPATETPAPAVTAAAPQAGTFCDLVSSDAPPTAIFGLVTVGGENAAQDVEVTVLFNGLSAANAERPAAGSYKFEFAMGPEGCVNRPGAAISFYVGGQYVDNGFVLTPGEPVFRFDIAVE